MDGSGAEKKILRYSRRGAPKVRAHLVSFVSTLFEIDISEEICGRFGSVRWINVCISTLLGFRSDDGVSASLFGGFRFLMKPEAQQTEKRHMMSVMSCGDVQRFERQG